MEDQYFNSSNNFQPTSTSWVKRNESDYYFEKADFQQVKGKTKYRYF